MSVADVVDMVAVLRESVADLKAENEALRSDLDDAINDLIVATGRIRELNQDIAELRMQ